MGCCSNLDGGIPEFWWFRCCSFLSWSYGEWAGSLLSTKSNIPRDKFLCIFVITQAQPGRVADMPKVYKLTLTLPTVSWCGVLSFNVVQKNRDSLSRCALLLRCKLGWCFRWNTGLRYWLHAERWKLCWVEVDLHSCKNTLYTQISILTSCRRDF